MWTAVIFFFFLPTDTHFVALLAFRPYLILRGCRHPLAPMWWLEWGVWLSWPICLLGVRAAISPGWRTVFSWFRMVFVAARLADSAVHKKDVGVCTFAHPELGPSHCPSTRISNAASARQMNIQCSHVKTWCMNIHRMWAFPLPYLPVDFKVAKFEFSR